MRSALTVFVSALLFPMLVTNSSQAQKAAVAPGAKPAAKASIAKKPVSFAAALTTGVKYSIALQGDFGLATGTYKCGTPNPQLPTGLQMSCDTAITLTGQTNETGSVHSAVVVTDVKSNQVELDLSFVVMSPDAPIVVGGPAPPPAAPGQPPPPVDLTKEQITQTLPIAEGAQEIKGELKPALGADASSYSVRVWAHPDQGPDTLLNLKPTGAAGAAAVTEESLGAYGTYDLTFVSPLPPGITVHVQVLDKSGNALDGPEVALPLAIPLPPGARLVLKSEIEANTTSIQGHVDMPAVPVKPTGDPLTGGNYPYLQVRIWDPDQNQWYVAPLAAGTDGSKTALSVPAGDKGDFTLTLKTPLKSGQKIRVDAIPPQGRTFTGIIASPGQGLSVTREVNSTLVLTQPTISTLLVEGVQTLTGVATPGTSVAFRALGPKLEGAPDQDEGDDNCFTVDQMSNKETSKVRPTWLPLKSSASSSLVGAADATNGSYNVTLAESLKEGDRIRVVEILPAGTELAGPQKHKCASGVYEVRYGFDWDRTNVSFVGGILISNSSSGSATNANFSQANTFLALYIDHAWRLPGADCIPEVHAVPVRSHKEYDVNGDEWGRPGSSCNAYTKLDDSKRDGTRVAASGWRANRHGTPGFSSFFEGRLTAIPVSSTTATSTTTATSSTGSSGSGTGTSSGSGSGTSSSSTSTFLTSSQKVFRVSTGVYFPWVVTHGRGDHPTGLFIGPLVKAGFDTITGAGTASNVLVPTTGGVTVGTLNFQTAYNNYSFGARLGNMALSASSNRAPLLDHYLDVTIGRYSNLQSYICHQTSDTRSANFLPGSTCLVDYPEFFPGGEGTVSESRKALYRLDFEGLIRIATPSAALPFYIGFNANIAQHTVGAAGLDHGYAPPDDIRILFGTKIDIGSLLSKMSLGGS